MSAAAPQCRQAWPKTGVVKVDRFAAQHSVAGDFGDPYKKRIDQRGEALRIRGEWIEPVIILLGSATTS